MARHEPIPEVPGLPVLGNALAMSRGVQPFIDAQYRLHGPIFRVRIPGRKIVVIGGREGIAFAREHSQTHLRSDEAFAPIRQALKTDRPLIASDGPDHIKLRPIVHSIYQSASVERNLPTVIGTARRVLASWHPARAIPAYAAMQELAIMQIGALAFGRSLDEHVDDIRYWNDALIVTMRRDRPRLLHEPMLRRARRRMEGLFRQALETAGADGTAGCPHTVMDDIVEAHRRRPEFISKSDLMMAVISPYFQSLDQMACALGIAVLRLLAEPRYAEWCQDEADRAFAEGFLGPDGIRGLDMTNALIAEVMRLHGTTPILLRTASQSFEFEGHWVSAGTEVWLASAVVHSDPAYYRNADQFDPERHLAPRLESTQPDAYVPFGVGPHSCIGQEFAVDLMAVNLATVLHYAEIDRFPVEDRRISITPYPHLRPRAKCRIQVKRMRTPLGGANGADGRDLGEHAAPPS